jgi:hypothetical protein
MGLDAGPHGAELRRGEEKEEERQAQETRRAFIGSDRGACLLWGIGISLSLPTV